MEIVTHPLFRKKLEVPLLNGLEEALKSHRRALSLDPDNADTLFNTAQVLTAIAEKLAKVSSDASGDVLKLLNEALDLQSRCLSVQEMKLEESETQRRAMLEQALDPKSEAAAATEPPSEQWETTTVHAPEDQWFSVVEPVTADTLTDTALAQLATLTTLCSVLSSSSATPPSPSLRWIEEFSSTLLTNKMSSYARNAEPQRLQEIALAKATFLSAFLEASFHHRSVDALTYKQERDNAFATPELLLEKNPGRPASECGKSHGILVCAIRRPSSSSRLPQLNKMAIPVRRHHQPRDSFQDSVHGHRQARQDPSPARGVLTSSVDALPTTHSIQDRRRTSGTASQERRSVLPQRQ